MSPAPKPACRPAESPQNPQRKPRGEAIRGRLFADLDAALDGASSGGDHAGRFRDAFEAIERHLRPAGRTPSLDQIEARIRKLELALAARKAPRSP